MNSRCESCDPPKRSIRFSGTFLVLETSLSSVDQISFFSALVLGSILLWFVR